MPKIMSAEELGEAITIECFGAALSGKGKGINYKIRDFIRSRDSAMLEKYKEAIATWQLKGQPGGTLALLDALDSAFVDIDGGK